MSTYFYISIYVKRATRHFVPRTAVLLPVKRVNSPFFLQGGYYSPIFLAEKRVNQTDVKTIVSLDTLQEAKQKQSGRSEILDDMSKNSAARMGKKPPLYIHYTG